MADSSKSPNSKKPHHIPSEQDLIEFNHVAAGHEGMSSNASGSLVIKPCTQAEIDFYESAKDHEHFQVHMPTFIGLLTLNQNQSRVNSIAPLLAQAAHALPGHAANRASISSLLSINDSFRPISSGTASPNTAGAALTPPSAKRASWIPSGGKKLDTGLAIVLENVAAGFQHPNILDVKLGARLWADDAPASKRRKLDDVSKQTTSGSLGFRIAGMKLWEGERAQQDRVGTVIEAEREPSVTVKDGYRVYNKHYGRNFTAHNVKDGFAEFLGGINTTAAVVSGSSGKPPLKRLRAPLVARRMIRELESIQYVLEHEQSRMYSASILMVYEGDEQALEKVLRDEEMKQNNAKPVGHDENELDEEDVDDETEDEDDDDEEEEQPKVLDVRLIDFAHASWTPGLGPDENVLQGVRNVIRILRELL